MFQILLPGQRSRRRPRIILLLELVRNNADVLHYFDSMKSPISPYHKIIIIFFIIPYCTVDITRGMTTPSSSIVATATVLSNEGH